MADHEKQVAQAEEILGDRLSSLSFVKGLFFGQYLGQQLPRYPDLAADEATTARVKELQKFCVEAVDADAIDRKAEIPQSVIRGLGR